MLFFFRTRQIPGKSYGGLIALIAAALACGCSSEPPVENIVAAKNDSNIKRVANFYAAYQDFNSFDGPKDEAALKKFAHDKVPPQNLKMMGVDPDKLDEMFISQRDGQPFKIRWALRRVPRQNAYPIVFESQGKEGLLEVAWTDGSVQQLDAAACQQAWDEKPAGPGAIEEVGPPPGAAVGPPGPAAPGAKAEGQ